MADRAEVHLVLEVPPTHWRSANFDAAVDGLAPGLHPADPVLAPFFPEATRAMWRAAASAHVLVTSPRRARHPASVGLMRRVLRWVADLEPDVLHLDDVDVSPRLALALPTVRRPYALVVGCHDPEPHSGEADWRTKALSRRLVLPRAAAVVVHHEGGAEAIARRHLGLHAPVRVVRLGAYTFLTHGLTGAAPARDPRTIALFGRLTPYKGVDLLYAAAPAVAAAVPGTRIVVAGEPAAGYVPPTPPAADGLTVDVRPGYLSTAEVAELCRSSAVVVCPYTDASQSGVVLTAHAFGAPVVATAVGGLPDYVDDGRTGLLVPPGDPAALAAALTRCLSEPGLADELRRGVADLATDGAWSGAAGTLLDLYAEVAARRGRRGRRGR
ncbi:glycosyltransferase family 4 protein [Oryzobacter terrae]|uniref:glycosyltransferase family 4 protein n=1 Tax=Oryzobacter terrae TaxID=1620385 RepID=UPI00366FED8B